MQRYSSAQRQKLLTEFPDEMNFQKTLWINFTLFKELMEWLKIETRKNDTCIITAEHQAHQTKVKEFDLLSKTN